MMEAFASYLFKSVVWLTGFALVYLLFLRNERYFLLNRIYLVAGVLASIIFPFFTWHYTIIIPMVPSVEISDLQMTGITQPNAIVNAPEFISMKTILFYFYLTGAFYLLYRVIRQTIKVMRVIRNSEILPYRSAKLIRTNAYPSSFSFFSFVFVNPSHSDTETNEIVNHEMEHVRQRHWIDLLLFELLCTLQWLNPMCWLYGRFIRQNHEFLADRHALQRSQNPAIYRAALINQLFGEEVISLANSFNYSINKKRFHMMKNTIQSPIRKLKLLVILPLIAGVFYAFAAPEYKYVQVQENSITAVQEATSVIKIAPGEIQDTTKSSVTTLEGNFVAPSSMGESSPVSGYRFSAKKIQGQSGKGTEIIKGDDISLDLGNTTCAIFIDGKEATKAEFDKLDPKTIASVSILKGEPATSKYGEKGKNGVIDIRIKEGKRVNSVMFGNLTGNANYQKQDVYKQNYITDAKNNKTISTIGDIHWVDNTIYSSSELTKTLGIKKGDVYPTEKLSDIIQSAINKAQDLYLDNGYVFSNIQIAETATSESSVDFTFSAFEGTRGKIGNISIKGNQTIPTADIFKKINIKQGDWFSKSKIIESVKAISRMENINPETIFPEIIPDSKNLLNNNTNVNIVFNITESSNGIKNSTMEQMPEFPGGETALNAYIAANIKYPAIALENGIHGKVIVNFVVDKTGRIPSAKITRGVDPALDREALRIVTSMPKWNPGKKNGENVTTSYELPIDFKLPADYNVYREKLRVFYFTGIKLEDQAPEHYQLNSSFDKNHKLMITLRNANYKGDVELSIFDTGGKLISKEIKKGPTFILDNPLTSGSYFIYVKAGSTQYSGVIGVAVSNTKSTYTKTKPDKKAEAKPAVNKAAQIHELTIVPNPTSDNVTVTLQGSDYKSKLQVSIFDKDGKLIYKESKTGPMFNLSFANFPSGNYFIVVKAGKDQYSGHLIVNH